MRLILCASSWSLISHWSADGRDCTVAKGQKDLLEILKDTLELPIIILEESLYEDLAPIITLLKEINPASTVLIMASYPTFASAQEMLCMGANGYANQCMSKEWLDEALKSLQSGENWIYPPQEQSDKKPLTLVGRVVDIGGKVKSDRLIGIGSAVYLDEAIELLEINSHIKVEFEAGNCVELKGKNRLYVDKSVASTKVDGLSSIIKERFALKQAVDVPLDRPFYINVGSESLIAPSSKELELREDGVYIGISQFYVQEEYELSFADEKPKEGVVKFRGEIEEYEILNSNIFKDSIIINDLVYGRDGGRVVYPDVKVLEFLNAKVDLCYTQEGRESIKLGNLIKLDDEKGEFDGVSITIKRHTQGRDYLLFDKNLVPKDVRFSYMIDDELIVLKFFGKSKHYVDLLKSLCHESGSLNTLHVQVEAGFKGAKICLFDGLI